MSRIGRPILCRNVSTGKNCLTFFDKSVTLVALLVAGIAVNAVFVIDSYYTVKISAVVCVIVRILLAEEGIVLIGVYLTASRAGLEVNGFFTAVARSLQRFSLLLFLSKIVIQQIAVRLRTNSTNSLSSTGGSAACVLCRKRTEGNFRDFFACFVEELSASITGGICIPTLILTIRCFLISGCLVCVSASNSYSTGVAEIAVNGSNRNSCRTLLNAGNLTVCINGNCITGYTEGNFLICSIRRIYGNGKILGFACLERHRLVDGYTGNADRLLYDLNFRSSNFYCRRNIVIVLSRTCSQLHVLQTHFVLCADSSIVVNREFDGEEFDF